MSFLLILWAAVLLDALLGDPRWFPHPVRLIGALASRMEQLTRKFPISETNSGRLTVLLVLLITGMVCGAFLMLLAGLSKTIFYAGAVFVLYTTIAARDLVRHARNVYTALGKDIDQARKAVAMIVGRDTDTLDEAGIVRACVESVAENMSDGIVAPLFWAVIGAAVFAPAGGNWPVIMGVSAAMLYKAVNTMDSMFGYKNERFFYFGSCPARLDDVVNFVPARLSGLAIVLAASFCACSMRNSWNILRRDRASHTSPNAGWPEAAMAGALGIQLGGSSSYGGKLFSKPTLGNVVNPVLPEAIGRANRLVLSASLLILTVLTVVFSGFVFCR
jgi:adenosylcobinamide-phosphate synthase